MALISCPECGKEISDKAVSCPHCGMPLQAMPQPASISPSVVPIAENSKPRKKRNITKILIGFAISATLILGLVVCYFIFFEGKFTKPKELDFDTIEKSVVKVVCYDWLNNISATGSGFLYLDSRNVVTNYHVIEDAYKIEIITYDDQVYEVDLILNMSPLNDVALLRPKGIPYDAPYLSDATSKKSEIAKGDKVYAIGSPLGIKNTISEGIVSGWVMDGDMQAIQCTAPISPGSSGGALLDEYGNVIGITYSSYTSGQNINLAIPIKYATELWNKRSNNTNTNVTYEFLQSHEYGESASLYSQLYSSSTESITLYDLQRNPEAYIEHFICFDAYVSSFDDWGNGLFYVSLCDGSNLTGNLDDDMNEAWDAGLKNTSHIIVLFNEMRSNYKVNIGDYVTACAWYKDPGIKSGLVWGYLLVDDNTDGYYSSTEYLSGVN